MYHDLYTKVSKACCYLTVFLGDEKISDGTGFAFNPSGQVITAGHVVTGRMPIRVEDYRDPAVRIFAKFPGRSLIEYRVGFCGITIILEAFSKPIQIDQAVLIPVIAQTDIPIIPARIMPPRLGEQVFFAGYSDELELPFLVDKLLKPEVNGSSEFFSAMNKGYLADMTGPLIKRGVIGNVRRICAENTADMITIECDVFYIDNSIHSGASGGPIFNNNGEAVGVITKRAITSASQSQYPGLEVPSGATIGLSLQAVELACRRISA